MKVSTEKQQTSSPAKTKIDPNPTPDAEANTFSTIDERREGIRNRHSLDIHDRNLGSIGRFTGSINSSLNIAFVLLAGLLMALFVCLAAAIFKGMSEFGPHIEKLITAILTVGGFIFGVKSGADK